MLIRPKLILTIIRNLLPIMKKHLTPPLLTGLFLGLAVLFSIPASAQQMNYQGRLTDTNGNALLDGRYILTFNLYATPSGGTALWGPFLYDGNSGNGHAAQADLVSGRFNVILGPLDTAGRSLPPAFVGGANRYLGIKIGTGGSEISPRQQILAAPEALHASIADTVANGAIGTAQLGPLAVTGANIADNTITVAKLTGAGANFWDGNGTDIYRASGKVGIATAAPNSRLHVNGDGVDPSLRVQVSGNTKLIVHPNGGTGIGANTTAPQNGLQIQGEVRAMDDVTVGGSLAVSGSVTVSGKSVAVGEENNLRLVRGWGTANTTVGVTNGPLNGVGGGFTYVKRAQGSVDVYFNTPFTGAPSVTANAIAVGGVAIFCQFQGLGAVGSPGPDGFRINMFDVSQNGRDWPFSFIAVGTR